MVIYILHRQVALALDRDGRVAIHHQQIDLAAVLAGTIAADQILHGAVHLETPCLIKHASCHPPLLLLLLGYLY